MPPAATAKKTASTKSVQDYSAHHLQVRPGTNVAFINAMAWIANSEGHHPDFSAGYNFCHVQFTTHDVGGLSENDFICAAKVNDLLDS